MKYFSVLAFVVIVGIVAFIWRSPTIGPYGDVSSIARDYEDIRKELTHLIDDYGASEAVSVFTSYVEALPYDRQHLLSHIFGEALYEHAGLESFIFCGTQFGFGCQHGFFGSAIEEEGPGVSEKLDAACVRAYGERGTGCTHGIGHGALSYFGDDLVEALALCRELTWKGDIGGCSSGVFMEHNFRTMQNARQEQLSLRPFEFSKRHEPCASLSSYRISCYFEQPAWWRSTLEVQDETVSYVYATLGQWCGEVSQDAERTACFMGIGNVIPANAGYDVSLSVERCGFIQDKEGKSACRKGAAWGFFVDPSRRDQALYMCEFDATPEEKQTCASEYRLI